MFRPKRSEYGLPYEEMVDKLLLKETTDEMFKFLGYEPLHNHRYEKDEGDMCYHFINFHPVLKELEFGFYDGYETKREEPARIDIIMLIPVVKKMEELGWIELNRKDEVAGDKVNFRMVGDMSVRNKNVDTIGFTFKFKYKDNPKYFTERVVVAMIVHTESGIPENPMEFANAGSSQSIVLKTIHKNSKGYFYVGNKGKGYGSSKVRVFLTEEEVELMYKFLDEVKEFHKDVIIDDNTKEEAE